MSFRIIAMRFASRLVSQHASLMNKSAITSIGNMKIVNRSPENLRQSFRGFTSSRFPGMTWRHSIHRFATDTHAYQYEPVSNNNYQDPIIEEVDFDPSLINTITLMGNVGKKPELKYLENGNKVTTWSIAYTEKKDAETQWLDVEAWGPLAERAHNEVDRGQKIAVQGRLKIRNWTDNQGTTRKSIRIVANSIKRIRYNPNTSNTMGANAYGGGSSYAQQQDTWQQQPQQQQQQQAPPSNPSSSPSAASYNNNTSSTNNNNPQVTTEELWMSLFEDISGWYDNRPRKESGEINSKSPDFKRKEGGRDAPALWIDSRTTPAWVKTELEKLDAIASDLPPF